MFGRIPIAIGLSLGIIFCLYFNYLLILFCGINLAILYDAIHMYHKLGVSVYITIIFFILGLAYNFYLLTLYYLDSNFVVKIVTISEVSDIYQYITGVHLGNNKIGWISKNKTYEGYILGFILTLSTFVPVFYLLCAHTHMLNGRDNCLMSNTIYDVTIIYILGIIGGLISSLFKRIIDIKDYSDLLGPHGGWTDRIDSIILPSLSYYFVQIQ